MTSVTHVDIDQMRDQVFFDGPERRRRLSRYWDLDDAGLASLDVRVSLVTVTYQPLPK